MMERSRTRNFALMVLMAGAVLLVSACSKKTATQQAVDAMVIEFDARVGAEPYGCGSDAPTPAFGETTLEPGVLRLFVHDFELTMADGSIENGKLIDDGFWQTGNVALLDFEDGTARCRGGSGETNTKVLIEKPSGDVKTVAFRVGVPFDENHADPAKASGPLTYTSMHWSWKAGYKFLRLDGKTAEGEPYSLHLGSTGCKGSIGDIESCARPNRPRIELGNFDVHNGRIALDVAQMVAAGITETGDDNYGCLGEKTQPGCVPVFRQFGLDFESGRPVTGQLVFSTE